MHSPPKSSHIFSLMTSSAEWHSRHMAPMTHPPKSIPPKWNELAKVGNPTRLDEVNDLVAV
eukprot:15354725-Ditylum_brightwellii.AAC.1